MALVGRARALVASHAKELQAVANAAGGEWIPVTDEGEKRQRQTPRSSRSDTVTLGDFARFNDWSGAVKGLEFRH